MHSQKSVHSKSQGAISTWVPGEKQWPQGPAYELGNKGAGGGRGGWTGGHEKRMAKVLAAAEDLDWGEREAWQPRRAVTRDFGSFFPVGHEGQYRSWQAPVIDPVTGRRSHAWLPFATKTQGRNTATLELGDMKGVEDMTITWHGGRYFGNKNRPVKERSS